VVTLLDDIGPDAHRLLDVLLEVWGQTGQWPKYVAHQLATAGLDLRDVLRDLPQWDHGYQAVRQLRSPEPVPGAPAELADRITPTVYCLVQCKGGPATQMVMAFLGSISVGYAQQLSSLPDPVTVKAITLSSDALTAGLIQRFGRLFGEHHYRQARLMLAGEPATWLGVHPDPDAQDWKWDLWFGSLRDFAVETGTEYLAGLEQLIGAPPQPADAGGPVEPSALPRALDHLDSAWHVVAGQALFIRPGFGRAASLAEEAASAVEFEARCNALYDVLSMLNVPKVDQVQGALNLLKADLPQHIADPEPLERAMDAVSTLQQLVRLRRGQTHSQARQDSLQAAVQLGVRLSGDWADSWNRVRRVAIEAIYALIEELAAVSRIS